jgi:superfamily II DNA or RNA helicase
MEKETIISCFKDRRSQHNIAFNLKNEQIEIAASVAKKRNGVGFLPTGFGKSFSFVLNAMVSDT